MTHPKAKSLKIDPSSKKLSPKLDNHKHTLLATLRKSYDSAPKKDRPFDPDKTWSDIELAAKAYVVEHNEIIAIGMTPGDRVKHYQRLAQALKRARYSITNTMKERDLAFELDSAWSNQPNSDAGQIEIMELEERIAALEDTARLAAKYARRRRGAPKTAALPPDCVNGLAHMYRESTGLLAVTTKDGPFVKFVCEFLIAMDNERDVDTVAKDVIAARKRLINHPGKWEPWPGEISLLTKLKPLIPSPYND